MKKSTKKWMMSAILMILCGAVMNVSCSDKSKNKVSPTDDSSQFVTLTDIVPDAILEIRYFSTYNFVGQRIDGYLEPTALLTRQAADSLQAVSKDVMAQGYRLKIYRKEGRNDQISFKMALLYCFRVFFNASIIFSILQWAYMQFLDPNLFSRFWATVIEMPEMKAVMMIASRISLLPYFSSIGGPITRNSIMLLMKCSYPL